jgi:hypothetical protein
VKPTFIVHFFKGNLKVSKLKIRVKRLYAIQRKYRCKLCNSIAGIPLKRNLITQANPKEMKV